MMVQVGKEEGKWEYEEGPNLRDNQEASTLFSVQTVVL
jgi:hypothetical protein